MPILSTLGAGSAKSFGLTRRVSAGPDAFYNAGTFRLKMPFNNTTGIADLSSNAISFTNNNCSISGSQSKYYGQALYVPNTNTVNGSEINRIYASASSVWGSILNSSTTFYTSAWVYLTAIPNSPRAGYFWGSDVAGVVNGFYTYVNNDGTVGMGWQDYVNSSANAISANAWTHILYSFNATGKVHKLYINGINVATVNNQSIFYNGSQDKFHVGIRDGNQNVSQPGFYIQDLVIKTGTSVESNFTPPGSLV